MREFQISFEYFPPKSIAAAFELSSVAQRLDTLSPRFVSMTCGADGSDQSTTQDAVNALQSTSSAPVAAHITCATQSKSDIDAQIDQYISNGITQFVALRGDAAPHSAGYQSSIELIHALKSRGAKRICVGAYPDVHPDAKSLEAHVAYLARKFDAGADEAITQFFFDVEAFYRLRDLADPYGFADRLTPGIIPIENWTRIRGFAQKCAINIPLALDRGFETACRDGHEALFALTHTTTLCDKLLSEGVQNLHIFTLNKAATTLDIASALGKSAKIDISKAA